MTQASVTDVQREAFEKWAIANGHPVTIRDDGSDRYVSTLTNLRWQGWSAALSTQPKAVSVEDVVKMQELAESWRVKHYDYLGEPAYLKCAEDLTAIIGEGD